MKRWSSGGPRCGLRLRCRRRYHRRLLRRRRENRPQREARVLRDNVVVYEGRVSSSRRFKDDVREVAEGYECGIGIERFNDVKEGDVIEAFEMQEV